MQGDTYQGVQKIISGGQTGADRAGLEAAKILGIPTGGFAPQYYRTEYGPDLKLRDFGLVAIDSGYIERTKQNVIHTDGTIAIRLHPSSGTDKTIGFAHHGRWCSESTSKDNGFRPVLVINSLEPEQWDENMAMIRTFLTRNKIKVLNIAGHRESSAGIVNFQQQVTDLLVSALGDR